MALSEYGRSCPVAALTRHTLRIHARRRHGDGAVCRAGAHGRDQGRLFEHLSADAGLSERRGRGDPANPGAYDRDPRALPGNSPGLKTRGSREIYFFLPFFALVSSVRGPIIFSGLTFWSNSAGVKRPSATAAAFKVVFSA